MAQAYGMGKSMLQEQLETPSPQPGEWRVRPWNNERYANENGKWTITNSSCSDEKSLSPTGHPVHTWGNEKAFYPTQSAAQAVLDEYLDAESQPKPHVWVDAFGRRNVREPRRRTRKEVVEFCERHKIPLYGKNDGKSVVKLQMEPAPNITRSMLENFGFTYQSSKKEWHYYWKAEK